MESIYTRSFVNLLKSRLTEVSPLIQVIAGPRQVGKTTGIKQLLSTYQYPYHFASADDVLVSDRTWLIQQWQKALSLADDSLLVIDEIQKIPGWSEIVKSLWDNSRKQIKVVILGSSSLQIQAGLKESLAGRFELINVYHWRFQELKEAFGYTLDRYLVYGGYPGAVRFEQDFDRWFSYMKNSIVESVVGKDILINRKVGSPALFRQAFEILCHYPACEISYTKLLGQLQDKGNTDLVKYYIELYSGAFLLRALNKYSAKEWLSKSSSPKILLSCPALYTMASGCDASKENETRGRLFELAVGNELASLQGDLTYWRERDFEVDFVYSYRGNLFAVEVKSGRKKSSKGLEKFTANFPTAKPIIISTDNFDDFSKDPEGFLNKL